MRRPAQPQAGMRWLEFRDQCALVQILDRWCSKSWRFTHLPMGELRQKRTAGRLKAMGVRPGWPDFIFVGPGKVCFLELKRREGSRLSPEQGEIFTHLMACGCGYALAYSVEDAVGMLKDWGILPASIHLGGEHAAL